MLSSIYRFHGHNSLRYVYKNGTTIRGALYTVKYIRNTRRKKPRIAIVVSKKIHKGAVVRNRIRRRLYEVFRENLQNITEPSDIVCIVTSPTIVDTDSRELAQQIAGSLEKAGLYKNT